MPSSNNSVTPPPQRPNKTKHMKSMVKFVANPLAEIKRKKAEKSLAKSKAEGEKEANVDAFLQGGRDRLASQEARESERSKGHAEELRKDGGEDFMAFEQLCISLFSL